MKELHEYLDNGAYDYALDNNIYDEWLDAQYEEDF